MDFFGKMTNIGMIRGTRDDLIAMLNAIKAYINADNGYTFTEAKASNHPNDYYCYKNGVSITDMSDEEIINFATSTKGRKKQIFLFIGGPNSADSLMENNGFFEELACAAPAAEMSFSCNGTNSRGFQVVDCSLKDKILILQYNYHDEAGIEDEAKPKKQEKPFWDLEVIYDPIEKKILERKIHPKADKRIWE